LTRKSIDQSAEGNGKVKDGLGSDGTNTDTDKEMVGLRVIACHKNDGLYYPGMLQLRTSNRPSICLSVHISHKPTDSDEICTIAVYNLRMCMMGDNAGPKYFKGDN